jgi:DNA-binding NarL/FixJ family response regulator
MRAIRLIVVDRYDASRSGFSLLVSKSEPAITVVGSFPDFALCETFLRDNAADVMLIDDNLPKHIDLSKWLRTILTQQRALSCILLTHQLNLTYLRRLMDVGTHGIIHKDDRVQETLVTSIYAVNRGETWLSNRIAKLTMNTKERPEGIRQRALDILYFLVRGYSVGQIGAQLGLSEASVYRELARLRDRFEASTNEQLVNEARKRGLLAEDSDG